MQIEAGVWEPEKAEDQMESMLREILPGGHNTKNHSFYSIVETELAHTVASLWFSTMEKEGKKYNFVYFLHIQETFQQRGFGSQAFEKMEALTQEMGIDTIKLNVHPQNHIARAMYQKLGYVGTETELSKVIM